MKYSELVNEVLLACKRPDKINSIKRELNAALTFYCLDNNFSRDTQENTFAIDPNQYSQTLALSLLDRYRKLKYIKYAGLNKPLSLLGDSEMFKPCVQADKYYIVGDTINFSLSCKTAGLDIGWYKFPPILTGAGDNDSFWLLDIAPWMVFDRAAAIIFREIGDEKSMQTHAASAREQYLAARKDLGISTQ